jgi:hypothetical protein
MEEFTPSPPSSPFDTYIPGLLSVQRAGIVGAVRMGSFEVFPEGDDTYTLLLRYYWPRDDADGPSAQEQAAALRQFIVPSLHAAKDCVVELPESAGAGLARRYLLLTMLRDESRQLRGVGAFVVECPHLKEAERRLLKLREISVEWGVEGAG